MTVVGRRAMLFAAQEAKVDERPMAPVPPDPLRVFRFGLGLRYGRR